MREKLAIPSTVINQQNLSHEEGILGRKSRSMNLHEAEELVRRQVWRPKVTINVRLLMFRQWIPVDMSLVPLEL